MGTVGGLLGIIVIIADIWALVQVLQSGADTAVKILWVVVIIVLPVVGLLAWFFLGPR